MRVLKAIVGGTPTATNHCYHVTSPFDGRIVSEIGSVRVSHLQTALAASESVRYELAELPAHRRAAILTQAAAIVKTRREELAATLVEEAGKPLTLARIEVDRCVETFEDAALIARMPHSELLELGGSPTGEGRIGILRRFPVGVVVGITPFNFPLNLVAHKLAPAVAAGCPIVIKPASQTPSPALILAEIMISAGLLPAAISVLPCSGEDVGPLLDDPRVKLVSFTGSADVGWGLKKRVWDRRVSLELGGNAAVIVEPDAGDLAAIAKRITTGAFSYAGQSCISVQRILVNQSIAGEFTQALVEAARIFSTGDPAQVDVLCGPMITAKDADRIDAWLGEALAGGARRLTSWRREGNVVWPTLLDKVPPHAKVWEDEAFAPVAIITTYRDFKEALRMANSSRFGLQAGVFTKDIDKVQLAYNTLEVGAVLQGEMPSWRCDSMPYGGVKRSGWGREGARWAVEEMTEPRLLVLRERS